jgi:hypothetical protein
MLNFTCLLKVNFKALTLEGQSEKLTSQATNISTSTFCELLLRKNQLLPKKLEVPSLTVPASSTQIPLILKNLADAGVFRF